MQLVEQFTTEYGSNRAKITVSLFVDPQPSTRRWNVVVAWASSTEVMSERTFYDVDIARDYFDDWRMRLALTEASRAMGLDR